MPNTTTRPSGLVLTKVDDRRINWSYPPSGRGAQGTIVRSSMPGDVWRVSNVGSIRSGSGDGRVTLVGDGHMTLEKSIETIESRIAEAKSTLDRQIAEEQRKKDEEEETARQIQEAEQGMNRYMDEIFNQVELSDDD